MLEGISNLQNQFNYVIVIIGAFCIYVDNYPLK